MSGLGRGLSALLDEAVRAPSAETAQEAVSPGAISQVEIGRIRPNPNQPRVHFDEQAIAELADSIAQRGVLQPLLLRPDGDGYQIVAGERRWRAARIAGLERVPALVREVADDAALGIGLIENIQREDLSPIEEANGLKRLIEEFRLTHEEVAQAIGRSRAGVTNLLRLLELAPAVQEMVQEILDTFYTWPLVLPQELVYFFRAIALLEGIALRYDPARVEPGHGVGHHIGLARGDGRKQVAFRHQAQALLPPGSCSRFLQET